MHVCQCGSKTGKTCKVTAVRQSPPLNWGDNLRVKRPYIHAIVGKHRHYPLLFLGGNMTRHSGALCTSREAARHAYLPVWFKDRQGSQPACRCSLLRPDVSPPIDGASTVLPPCGWYCLYIVWPVKHRITYSYITLYMLRFNRHLQIDEKETTPMLHQCE